MVLFFNERIELLTPLGKKNLKELVEYGILPLLLLQ
jgi:hypothetical protein